MTNGAHIMAAHELSIFIFDELFGNFLYAACEFLQTSLCVFLCFAKVTFGAVVGRRVINECTELITRVGRRSERVGEPRKITFKILSVQVLDRVFDFDRRTRKFVDPVMNDVIPAIETIGLARLTTSNRPGFFSARSDRNF
ncbi:MAG: hypothetical protein HOQ02_00865 [Lysobacter sp.]|nr:hypothetical protein [Lysobacter sp.]